MAMSAGRIEKTLVCSSLILAVAAGAIQAQASRIVRDPIEGKWWGVAGFERDRIVTGLEFKRDSTGALRAYMYRPVVHVYGEAVPGTVERDTVPNTYALRHTSVIMSFVLQGRRLEGTQGPVKIPFSLTRVTSLPTEKPEPRLPMGPGPRWRTKLGAPIYAPAAVYRGVAYVGTTGGMFYAVDVARGEFVWNFPAGRPIHGEALVTDDAVYFVCDNGWLYKLARETGLEIWRYDLDDARVERILPHLTDYNAPHSGDFNDDVTAPKPTLRDSVLYVGSGTGMFHAVNAASGKRIWAFMGDSTKIRTDAAVVDSLVVFGTIGGAVYAVDRRTGRQAWKRVAGGSFTSSATLIDGEVVIGNRGGALFALRPATGQTDWRDSFWGSSVESTAVPGDSGVFYIGSSDMRSVVAIGSRDGRVLWRADIFGWAWPRPAVTPTTVYAASVGTRPYHIRHTGGLSAIDRRDGKILWRWPTSAAPGSLTDGFAAGPVVDDGVLVIGGLDGTLYAFPIAATANGPGTPPPTKAPKSGLR